MNPLQGSNVLERCGAVRILELADEIYRDRACRSALAVVPCASLPWPMNLLQGSGVSERSRCGAVPIPELADDPLQGSGVSERSRCGAVPILPLQGSGVSLWCRANP